MTRLAILFWLLLCGPVALAQPATTLNDVLESSLRHYPRILAAQRDVAGSEALVLAAEGAFDPRLDGKLGGRPSGYYDGSSLDAEVTQNFPLLNSRVFGGYRVSDGSFPLYGSDAQTLSAGEVRAGVGVSLWRDRVIDERRAALQDSRLGVVAELQQLRALQLDVLQSAFVAYSRWLMAARLEAAYQELLALAEARGVALATQIQQGAAAEILQVENDQAILQRRALVVDATRQREMAAQALALFWRDAQGAMQQPVYAPTLELPPEQEELLSRPVEDVIAAVLEQRPEIRQLQIAQAQAELDEQLARNSMQPKVDLEYYLSRDQGSGPVNLLGSETVASLSFSVPLRTRTASGKLAAARAEQDSLGHGIRQLQDQLGTDIRQALVNLEATRALEQLAEQELTVSLQLAAAEEQRFQAGISDFFLLNLRERQVGEAQLKRLQAALTHQIALAGFYAATMSFEGFGVELDETEL